MEAPRKPGLVLAGTREMLLPFTVVGCFVLYYLVHVPRAVVLCLAVPMLLLYAMAPRLAKRSVEQFDRDVVGLLAGGNAGAMAGRYQRALAMRLFAPPAVTAERRALVAAENGQLRQARAAYREAFHEYGGQAPLRVLLGYAHASYELGDDEEAIRVYRQLLETSGSLPGVERNLAHAQIRHGQSVAEALETLERIAVPADAVEARAELDLLKALGHAKLGEPRRAQALAEASASAHSDLAESLREELRAVLEPVAQPRA